MKRFFKRLVYVLVALVALAVLLLIVTGNQHVLYGITKTYFIGKSKPDIDDLSYFSTRKMEADRPEPTAIHSDYNIRGLSESALHKHDSMCSVAFLVYKHDSLLFERYWDHYSDTSLVNSFSMAKSFTAILIGKAIEEGYIKGLDQPVSDFLPQYSDGLNAKLTIRNLLQMTSGIPFGESYASPFGYMAKAYYGKYLEEETMKFKVENDPGTLWVYEGGNTVLLGLILEKATGRTPSDYFFQKIWSCIGAEHPAYWNLDHENGLEKTFSGFYATSRDFARIGLLFAHNGVMGRDTIINPSFVHECLVPNMVPDAKGEACNWYGLHWWIGKYKGMDFYSCRGMRGQYIMVLPDKDLVVVRLGHNQSKERENHMPPDMFWYLDQAVELSE